MPRYRFVGHFETVLHGLSHAVNATLHREEHGQPDGSTVVAAPGDEIETADAYPHPLMVNVDTGEPDPQAHELEAAAAAAKPKRARRSKADGDAPPDDPTATADGDTSAPEGN